jgi:hypothetical protein
VSQRIKGQEVELMVIVDGAPQNSTTNVRSFEVTAKTEIKEEGYLGETTNRFDEIFNGVHGQIEFHVENSDFLNVTLAIIDRARRRTPGIKINIKATLNFPNGDRPRVLMQDCFFGEQPIGFGSRSDYGTYKLEFACSDIKRI